MEYAYFVGNPEDINKGEPSDMRIMNRDFYEAACNSDIAKKISEAVGL